MSAPNNSDEPSNTDIWGTAAAIAGVAVAAQCPWTEFLIGVEFPGFGIMLVEEHGFQNPTGTEERVDVMGDGVFLEYVLVQEGIVPEEIPSIHDFWMG